MPTTRGIDFFVLQTYSYDNEMTKFFLAFFRLCGLFPRPVYNHAQTEDKGDI
jgi:hypothetical protein